MNLLGVITLALGVVSSAAQAANLTVRQQTDYSEEYTVVAYHGEIDPRGMNQLYHYVTKHNPKYVEWNSPGGHFRTGLQLADYFREKETIMVVPEGSYCASACFFILTGKDDFIVDGVAGLHSPYIRQVDARSTMLEIGQVFGHGYILMAEGLMRNGFTMPLIVDTSEFSTPFDFLVFTNAEDILHYKGLDRGKYHTPRWEKMTGGEMVKLASGEEEEEE